MVDGEEAVDSFAYRLPTDAPRAQSTRDSQQDPSPSPFP